MAPLIQRIEEWAYEYEQRNRYECPGGVIVPRVNIGAIRGGVPYKITKTVQQCAIYLDVRITPVQNPLDIREDLRRLVAGAGLGGAAASVGAAAAATGRGLVGARSMTSSGPSCRWMMIRSISIRSMYPPAIASPVL